MGFIAPPAFFISRGDFALCGAVGRSVIPAALALSRVSLSLPSRGRHSIRQSLPSMAPSITHSECASGFRCVSFPALAYSVCRMGPRACWRELHSPFAQRPPRGLSRAYWRELLSPCASHATWARAPAAASFPAPARSPAAWALARPLARAFQPLCGACPVGSRACWCEPLSPCTPHPPRGLSRAPWRELFSPGASHATWARAPAGASLSAHAHRICRVGSSAPIGASFAALARRVLRGLKHLLL